MVFGFQGKLSVQFQRGAIALGRSFLLASGVSLLGWVGEAAAVETVVLQYSGQEQVISVETLSDFANSGTVPAELSDFFAEIGDLSELLPDILSQEIRISQDFIQSTLDTSLGEFVLIQLDQAMNTGRPEANINALRGTIEAAIADDGALSLIELIDRYPAEMLNVDLNGLQLAYTRVSNFIERVEPALRVAREFLQDLICDCETPTATEAADPSEADAEILDADTQSTLPAGGRVAYKDCARAELLSILAQLEAIEMAHQSQ
ncbi:MAG: alpha/beta hydrolase [Spirulinaceae cyanobacterium SM2_1_0]|nr:alpha/beta hydrolase [Spirulinaceae cyanobacterium SM2_1_0]